MIVPDYWAEARVVHRDRGRQITMRRFGWSMLSQDDAQAMAESRAADALRQQLAGKPQAQRDRKVAYNGAQGLPIREEVLSRHGEHVITRNAYGAHCLNTADVVFADIDFAEKPPLKHTFGVFALLLLGAIIGGIRFHSAGLAFVFALFALIGASPVSRLVWKARISLRGGQTHIARQGIAQFAATRPNWNIRLYATPGGLRLLLTHQPFASDHPEISTFFTAVGVDPLYARMCSLQHCFRARLTAKPWRIGIRQRMRPSPGIWPINPAKLETRRAWVTHYEAIAKSYAACRYLDSIGSGQIHASIAAVVTLHDRESQALNGQLPLA